MKRYLLLCVVLVLALPVFIFAEDAKEFTFDLERVDNLNYQMNRDLHYGNEYDKEPDLQNSGQLERADIFGYKVLWDKSGEQVYIDFNKDGDLTNDADGVFKADNVTSWEQLYRVEAEIDGVRHNFNLKFFTDWRAFVQVTVKSGYQGIVDFGGSRWYMALADCPDGKLGFGDKIALKKVDPSRDHSFADSFYSSEFCDVPFEIFVCSHNFIHTFSYSGDNAAKATMKFTEVPVDTATLKYDGTHIGALVFKHKAKGISSRLVWIDLSEKSCIVPAGEMVPDAFMLINPKNNFFGPDDYGALPNVKVEAGGSVDLPFGAPLRHTVKVSKFGNSIGLDYALRGKGDESYRLSSVTGDYDKASTVSIYKGGKLLSTGNFEYG